MSCTAGDVTDGGSGGKKQGDATTKTGNVSTTTNQLLYLKDTVMPGLWEHHFAWPFHLPVDPVKLNIPDYVEIVKHPMDMSHIMKKLDANQYSSADKCVQDVKLIFANCYLYNKPTDDIVVMAQVLERYFDEKIENMPEDEVQMATVQSCGDTGV